MTGKDASAGAPRWRGWKSRLSLVAVAAAILLLCLWVRQFWGPDTANAQTSRTKSRPVARSGVARRPKTRQTKAAPRPAAGSAESGVVAVVNGQQIARQQLAHECLRRFSDEVLDSIVNKHLIWQECQRLNIRITEADVNQEIERMAKKFGLPTDRWLTMLEQERDITPDKYRRDIIWPTLALRRLASGKIEVTQQELRNAFESEYGEKVKVRMISVSTQEKANQVLQLAQKSPERFGELAKQYSEDANSAAARGLIPPIRKHVGHKELEEVAFALKEGEISRVVHAANQFIIFKCEAHIPKSYVSTQQLAQLETQLHDQIRDQKLRQAAAELFQQLQSKAQVVRVFNDPQRSQQMPGVAATINGQQITTKELADECLLRHGKDVLEGEINRTVLAQELKRRGKRVTDAAINEEIARAADSYNYNKPDGTPDIDGWLKSVTEIDNVTVELYVHDAVWPSVALKQLVQENVAVTNEDIQKGFKANYGERVEALAIVLSSQRIASKVWEQARANPTEKFFGELANLHSVEPVSKANSGKIPPIRLHGGQPLIEKEAFRLKPGELSGIISVGDKYIILRCLGRTEPIVQDFNAVQDELVKDIHEKKLRSAMAEEFDRLRESAQIDNFLAGTSQPGKRRTAAGRAPTTRRSGVAPAAFQPRAPNKGTRR